MVKITIEEYKRLKQYDLEEDMKKYPLTEEEVANLETGSPVYAMIYNANDKLEESEWFIIRKYNLSNSFSFSNSFTVSAIDIHSTTKGYNYSYMIDEKILTKENGYHGRIELYRDKPELF